MIEVARSKVLSILSSLNLTSAEAETIRNNSASVRKYSLRNAPAHLSGSTRLPPAKSNVKWTDDQDCLTAFTEIAKQRELVHAELMEVNRQLAELNEREIQIKEKIISLVRDPHQLRSSL